MLLAASLHLKALPTESPEGDADADDVSGMSASKMRQLVHVGDKEGFINALPRG